MAKTVEIEETEIQAAGLPEEPKSGVWYVVLAWFWAFSAFIAFMPDIFLPDWFSLC